MVRNSLAMLKLAFDGTLKFGIRPKIKLAIFAVPAICMLISFVFWFFFTFYLADYFGIVDGVALEGQENDSLWFWTMIGSLPIFNLVGYVTGWILNIIGAMLILRWPYSKVNAIFGKSQIPQRWCRAPASHWHN